jgi:hypothetical protein
MAFQSSHQIGTDAGYWSLRESRRPVPLDPFCSPGQAGPAECQPVSRPIPRVCAGSPPRCRRCQALMR